LELEVEDVFERLDLRVTNRAQNYQVDVDGINDVSVQWSFDRNAVETMPVPSTEIGNYSLILSVPFSAKLERITPISLTFSLSDDAVGKSKSTVTKESKFWAPSL
ncbi:MAG: hypothetical protein AAF197_09220, partial [Pseudomonadota bacterium]